MKLLDKILKVLAFFTAVSLAFLVVLVVYDATMRYLFSEGSTALQELEWHLFDVVILFSIAYTLRYNSHVRVDIFYDKFPKNIKHIVNILSIVFFVLPFSILIIYMGYDFVFMSFIQNEASSDPGGLPYRWIVKSFMIISFALLILEALSKLFEEIKELKQ
jgi:TRAP-type mannitol/chloroaromatic compound transport system permease small subunit